METSTYDCRKRPVHTVALGLTKAMHEFLTLHYFATDSASSWDTFVTEHILLARGLLQMNDDKVPWTFLKSAISHRRIDGSHTLHGLLVSVSCLTCSLEPGSRDTCARIPRPKSKGQFLPGAFRQDPTVAFVFCICC